MSTSSTSNNCIHYKVDDSPAHFQRPAMYLKQLRERRDTRSCDIIFLLENGEQERLHSAIACGHSSRLAKMISTETKLPMFMDLSQYPSSSVRLVVDWMYKGTADIHLRELANHLVVASDLCVVFLHRQLEQTLRLQSQKKDSLVGALNIATHPSTGISASTVNEMVKIIAEREQNEVESLSMENLRGMTLRSVMSLVAIRIKQADKAVLINVALNWLRLHPSYVDDVISSITVMGMSEADLNAFRMTLTSAMRNPNLRRHTYVCQKKDANWLAINVDAGDMSASPSISGSSIDSNEYDEQMVGMEKTKSEIEEIKALPSDSFKKLPGGSKRQPRRQSTSSLVSFTGSVGSSASTVSGKHRSYTRSEMRDIGNLPDIFASDESQLAKDFVKWERKDSSSDMRPRETNLFNREPISNPKTAPRSYTRSEVDEIRGLPDMFNKKTAVVSVSIEKEPPLKQSTSVSTASSMSQTTLNEAREMQLKTLGKRDRAADEASEIRQLDVSFSKDKAVVDANPRAVNSSYANVPKTSTSSYYAF